VLVGARSLRRVEKITKIPKYEFYSYSRQRLHLLFYVYYFVLGAFKSVKRINRSVPRDIPRALSDLERDLE